MKPGQAVFRLAASSLILSLAGCATAGPRVNATPTPIPLGPLPSSVALPEGSAAPFAIYDNVLAWAGIPNAVGACPRNDVYLANIRAYHPRIIWRGGQCAVLSGIRVSPAWVVWSAGASPGGSVWGHQRATGRTYRIAGQPHPVTPTEPCATLDCFPNLSFGLAGNIAVWSQTEFTPEGDELDSSILGKVLPYGRPKVLWSTTAACTIQTDPFLGAGRLVWLQATWPIDAAVAGQAGVRQCRGPLQTNVMTETIRATFRRGRGGAYPSQPTQITTSGLTSNPQTDGRFVSWLDTYGVPARCACSDLDIFDTRTDNVLTLATGVTDYVISGRIVSWIQRLPHSERVRVARIGPRQLRISHVHTLATAGLPTTGRFIRTYGWPSNQRLVWELDTLSGLSDKVRVVIRDVRDE